MEWLRERIQAVPVRLVFESALELMGCTQIGTFKVSRTRHAPVIRGHPSFCQC